MRIRAAIALLAVLACVAVTLSGVALSKARSRRAYIEANRRHTIHLAWQPPVNSREPVVGYNIYRSSDEGGSYSKLNTLPVPRPEYDDATVRRATTYFYFVKSVGKKGVESQPSNEIRMTVP